MRLIDPYVLQCSINKATRIMSTYLSPSKRIDSSGVRFVFRGFPKLLRSVPFVQKRTLTVTCYIRMKMWHTRLFISGHGFLVSTIPVLSRRTADN
jgi:hypothetical protein